LGGVQIDYAVSVSLDVKDCYPEAIHYCAKIKKNRSDLHLFTTKIDIKQQSCFISQRVV
jgi:hypothetical protein